MHLPTSTADYPAPVREGHLRSVVKAASWRITGTVDTFILSYVFTGSVKLAVLDRTHRGRDETRPVLPARTGLDPDLLGALRSTDLRTQDQPSRRGGHGIHERGQSLGSA